MHKVTAFGIHLNLVEGKILAKLDIDDSMAEKIANKSLQINSMIPVKIRHLSPFKIVVEMAEPV